MQSANVSPVFLSQDTDLKAKNNPVPSGERANEAEFSRLVAQHVSDESNVTSDKESQGEIASASATLGNDVAANGKNDTDEVESRQESDYSAEVRADSANQDNSEHSPANNVLATADDKTTADSANNDALAESEQFIALLYNSDQTLTNTAEKSTKSEPVNSQQIIQANKSKVGIAEAKQDSSVTDADEKGKLNARNTVELSFEHKLKAFSKEELLAQSQLKNVDFAQQPGEQLLKNYQQSLQSISNNQSITSEQLTNAQLTAAQLNNNKVSDLAASISATNKSQITEQVDSGLYQLPVEPIGNDKLTAAEVQLLAKDPLAKDPLAKESLAKTKAHLSEKNVTLSAKPPGKNSAELPVSTSDATEKQVPSVTKVANHTLEAVPNKASKNEQQFAAKSELETSSVHSILSNISADKAIAERTTPAIIPHEITAKEQPVAVQAKQVNLSNAQVQGLQQAQQQQAIFAEKAELDTSSVHSILSNISADKAIAERTTPAIIPHEITAKEQPVAVQAKQVNLSNAQVQGLQQAQQQQAIDDTEYAEALLLSQEQPVEQGMKTTSKVSDNLATRSFSESQALTMQATQAKQSTDAYIEHQAVEVLSHNVASDIAQIQKNKVQLQQESIAIYRKDFADAVKDKVMIMISQKLQQFDIILDPPEFGNMQVRVNLQGEQATVNFVVQNQQAKEALEQNMQKLRDMLAEQGVDVGDATVEQQSQQENNDKNNLKQGNDPAALLTKVDEDEHTLALSAKLFDSSTTGVDYYA
ncbi:MULTISPECIES: flagellar hook-length control protein FliK [Colwellia]|uniref:Flagellar hook-length control protein FliK n=1 Tax=Colwellia marinimaniae TaxID=1513592 RepID=A0ABQ0MVA0_9GAMM|nr:MULTISPECIES: flagellar hook-length control protein FliK [Colwellia]GAW96299.1 flagellar hook-length control protein FliK [Colwellia marinimaniae]